MEQIKLINQRTALICSFQFRECSKAKSHAKTFDHLLDILNLSAHQGRATDDRYVFCNVGHDTVQLKKIIHLIFCASHAR